jgi:hypothetical protein
MFVKPFDFTKIAHDGSELPMSATFGGNNPSDWACTRDNVTQLIWEIKTYAIWPKFPGLRDVTHTYTWYNSDPATNGGAVGKASNGICFKTGRCDTEKYVADVNAQGLCGASDWRMPSVKEFESLSALTWTSDFGLNPDFFPNISLPSYRNHLLYLTGSPRAGDTTDMVWTINGLGMANNIVKTFPASVRLVRSAKR